MKGAISLEMIILIVLIIAVIAIVGNVIMTSSKNAANQISDKSDMIINQIKKSCITKDDCKGLGSGYDCEEGKCVKKGSTNPS